MHNRRGWRRCVLLFTSRRGSHYLLKKHCDNAFIRIATAHGFSYHAENGDIITKKGFFSFKKMWRAVRDVSIDTDIIIHCRIATHGEINAKTCHPFTTAQGFAIAHNGIINGYGNKIKSDTMDFIETIINNISSREDVARVLTATAKHTRQ